MAQRGDGVGVILLVTGMSTAHSCTRLMGRPPISTMRSATRWGVNVVGDQQHRRMPAVHHIDEQRLHLGAGDRVEGREGLVGKQQPRARRPAPEPARPAGPYRRELRRVGAPRPDRPTAFDRRRHAEPARAPPGAGLVSPIRAKPTLSARRRRNNRLGCWNTSAARMGLGQRWSRKHLTGGGLFPGRPARATASILPQPLLPSSATIAPADRQGRCRRTQPAFGMGQTTACGRQRLRGLHPGEGGVDQRRVHAALNAAWRASSPWSWVPGWA